MGFLKKITRPISKALDKIIPNEVKPFLPYVSAIAPYFLPPGVGQGLASIGIRNPLLQRALITGGLNLGSQLAQEGSEGDFSAMSLGLAGLQGALTAPGAADYFKGKQVLENYNPELAGLGQGQAAVGEQLSMLDKAKNIGLGALEKGAQYASGISETLQDPFGGTLTEFGKAAVVPFTQGTTDLAMSTARRALKDYEDELAAFNAEAGATTEASNAARRAAIISSMTAAKFDQDIIDDTLSQLGLKDGGRVTAMNGGIMNAKRGLVNAPGGYAGEKMDRGEGISIGIGKLYPEMLKQRAGEVVDFLSPSNIKDMPKDFYNFLKKSFNDPEGPYQTIKQDMMKSKDKKSSSDEGFGGIEKAVESVEQKPKTFLVDKLKVTVNPGESQEKAMLNAMFNDVDDVMPQDRKEEFYRLLIPKLKNTGEISDKEYEMLMQEVFSKAKGGIISLNMGGSVLPKGIEMDLRGGGFIPMGSMEKADDVPARVSKNEFVMTADAVRAAGGGSINKGAQRMYQLMNNLEARV